MFSVRNFLRSFFSTTHGFERRYARICHIQKKRVEQSLQSAGILTRGKQLEDFLQANKLADKDESIFQVFLRATDFLAHAGAKFYGQKRMGEYRRKFLRHVSKFEIILGTPVLTNAGRRFEKSISACSIPPVNFSKMTCSEIDKMISDYHVRGMGTGFCLDDLTNPVEMVKYLNKIAIGEVQRGEIERSVGNMGVLSMDHPEVLAFIRLKTDNPQIKEWKFNLSVNLTDKFYDAWIRRVPFALKNGLSVDPDDLIRQIAENAHATGDPGLIFMDRINQLNKLPHVGRYRTVVPCGEVSLYEGEVCQFAYLNLPRFEKGGELDRNSLRQAVHSAVLMLDNAVEANIERMPNTQSSQIISSIRRIGLGVCGMAELLQALGFPYDSDEGRLFAINIMSLIQFESKWASVELAKARGPFKWFSHPNTRTELFINHFANHPTSFVTSNDWNRLKRFFAAHKIRNLATTILPPSGQSAIMAGVTGSIEPPFRLIVNNHFKTVLQRACQQHNYKSDLQSVYDLVRTTGSIEKSTLPDIIKRIFRTALEISPEGHVAMTAACQMHIDEGIAKTVNLPFFATVDDILKIFKSAYETGLKGITVYRDGCRQLQPKALKTTKPGHSDTVIDSIYGPVNLSERIIQIMNSSLLLRLKGVHQNGGNFLVDQRLSTSRFEHSIGVMILTRTLGGDESVQISALLHDVAHTAFSHVSDLIFGRKNQDYHELAAKTFLQSEEAQQIIKKCGISNAELDGKSHPIVKGKGLNVDRLDYVIRDLKAVNNIFQPEYASIINDLTIGDDGEIQCKTIETARLLFKKFLQANQEIYFNPKFEAANLALALILRKMLKEGLLFETDLFLTDEAVIAKIRYSRFRQTYDSITPNMNFYSSPTPMLHSFPVLRKLRYVDPRIVGLSGRLTNHCPVSKKLLEKYLKTPKMVYYQLPFLKDLS